MKSFFSEYFSFSKQDRNAILVLATLILLLAAVKFFSIQLFKNRYTDAELKKQDSITRIFAASIEASKSNKYSDQLNEANDAGNVTEYSIPKSKNVFNSISITQKFNPNDYSYNDWVNAGFPEKFAKTIANYLSKGGRIKKPEDLKKVYGMKDEWFEKVKPFIEIPESKKETNHNQTFQKPKLSIVEINTADSAELEALPLIGGETAIRIIKYRNLIGGFVSLNQLKEVWGFKDSILLINEKRITIDATKISKININSVSMDELKKHPYIKFNKAKLIVNYREQHGKFHRIEDVRNIKTLTNDDINKISAYLNFE